MMSFGVPLCTCVWCAYARSLWYFPIGCTSWLWYQAAHFQTYQSLMYSTELFSTCPGCETPLEYSVLLSNHQPRLLWAGPAPIFCAQMCIWEALQSTFSRVFEFVKPYSSVQFVTKPYYIGQCSNIRWVRINMQPWLFVYGRIFSNSDSSFYARVK